MTAPNWVQERADCTPEDSFLAIKKRIEGDIDQFNRLEPEKRRNRLFLARDQDDGFAVFRAQRIGNHRGSRLIVDQNCANDFILVQCTEGLLLFEDRTDSY